MWQKFHILDRAQVFVLASVCAVVIALAIALASIPADGISWNRFLGPPRPFDPFINFGLAFVSVLPVFLGYYPLGRLGFLLSVAVGFALAWIMAVCEIWCFVFVGPLFGSVRLSAAAYAGCGVLVYLLIAWLHLKAAVSPSVRDAQRRLHLLPTRTI